jgi:hypothetical protein
MEAQDAAGAVTRATDGKNVLTFMLPGKVTFMGLSCDSKSKSSCKVSGSLMLDLQGSDKVASVSDEQSHHGKQLLDLVVSQDVAAIIDAGAHRSITIERSCMALHFADSNIPDKLKSMNSIATSFICLNVRMHTSFRGITSTADCSMPA